MPTLVRAARVPGLAGQDADLQGFLQGLFNVAIVVAGILALLMIVIGGVTYATTDAFSKKETGISMMTNAIFGLTMPLAVRKFPGLPSMRSV